MSRRERRPRRYSRTTASLARRYSTWLKERERALESHEPRRVDDRYGAECENDRSRAASYGLDGSHRALGRAEEQRAGDLVDGNTLRKSPILVFL